MTTLKRSFARIVIALGSAATAALVNGCLTAPASGETTASEDSALITCGQDCTCSFYGSVTLSSKDPCESQLLKWCQSTGYAYKSSTSGDAWFALSCTNNTCYGHECFFRVPEQCDKAPYNVQVPDPLPACVASVSNPWFVVTIDPNCPGCRNGQD